MLQVEEQKSTPPPLIIDYQDYRVFLRDYYQFKKSCRESFSFRQFAQMSGLKSPNYLQLVIQGKRNLTAETAERVGKALKLSHLELKYLASLVNEDNAVGAQAQEQARRNRLIAGKQLVTKFMDRAEKEVLSRWYHLLVKELVQLPDFVPDGEYISHKLCQVIDSDQAMESLNFLLKLGFIQIDSDGRYIDSEPVLSTGAGLFLQSQLQGLHRQTLAAWSKNLDQMDPDLQELHCLNIPISNKKIPELQKRIQQFQEELIGWLSDEKEPDRVIQLGTYLVPYK